MCTLEVHMCTYMWTSKIHMCTLKMHMCTFCAQTLVLPLLCALAILLATALAPQLLLNDCANACAPSILAILSAIAQFKYN